MSLLDNAKPAESATPGGTPPAQDAPIAPTGGEGAPIATQNNDWFYDENIKGDGDRPEWLKDKYKTAADQAKAYVEIEKKLGAFKGAPDEYDLTIKDYPELKFSNEDPLLKDFLDNAKKNGVSQEYVSELLGTYAQALTINIPDADAEMKKIGPNAAQDLQILSQWAGNYLSKEEFGAFSNMITTADAFRVFDKLRQNSTRAEVAPPGSQNAHHESEEQVRSLVSDPRYDSDPEFREDVRRRMSVALSKGGNKK